MSTELKLRRGTGLQHTAFTGSNGEATVNTSTKEVHVHDGVTVGGFAAVSRQNLSDPDSTVAIGSTTAGDLSKGDNQFSLVPLGVSRALKDRFALTIDLRDYGDLSTDSGFTNALKAAINAGKPTAATIGGAVIEIPAGNFNVTETILAKGSGNIVHGGLCLRGRRKGVTNINKVGTAIGEGSVNAVFQLANESTGILDLENNYNIEICDMNIGGDDPDYGIYSAELNAGINIHDCFLKGTIAGCSWGTIWQSRFERLDLRGATGFDMRASGTSNYLNSCFARLTTVAGYKLGGGYSFGSNLACDAAISGTAYLFNFATWELSGVGCESSAITRVVQSTNSRVKINNLQIFPLDPNNASLEVLRCSGGSLVVDGFRVNSDVNSVPQNMLGKLYVASTSGSISIVGNVLISDIWPTPTTSELGTTASMLVQSGGVMKSTPCFIRSGGQVGIGHNSASNQSKYLDTYHATPYMRVPAIITNVINWPYDRIDGASVEFSRGGRRGDLWLVDRPDEIRGIGWVLLTEAPAAVRDGEYKKIPYIDSGTTAQRPTVRNVVGQQYFDTTLGKPVWWKGAVWVDATGATV